MMEMHTVDDLIKILEEHPEWRERLRAVLLTEAEKQVPDRLSRVEEALDRLAQSHERAIDRLERLEASVEKLWESHQQALARLERLEASVEKLWESHQQALARLERLEASVEKLWESHQQALARLERMEESHQRLVQEVRDLKQVVERLVDWSVKVDDQLGKLRGEVLELRFHQRASAIFGYYVHRPRVVNLGDVLSRLKESGQEFTQREWAQLTAIDTLLSAKHPTTGKPIYIAVEISCVIHPNDVERICERAELLTQRGVPTFPVVAGEGVAPDALKIAEERKVLVLLDGGAQVSTNAWLNSLQDG
jgi:prefoldin subunit 5